MSFDRQPLLEGELLRMRPLEAEDYSRLYAAAADPEVWAQHPAKDRHFEAVFRAFFDEALESGGTLVAIDRRDGRIIGSSRFHGYDREAGEVEIGWTFLARSHWGGAYNGEMKGLMLRHAFRLVESVVFLIAPDNLRSRRATEKIGAVRDGRRLDAAGSDSLLYRLSRAAWHQRKASLD
jgi:RimJ/RimL family protein N-acetyltransferase